MLVVVTLLTSAALPLREFFEQRGDIAELQRSNDAARARVSALEHQQEQLQDPAYVAAEARRRLHYVMPGETAYVLIEPSPAAGAEDDRAEQPWYSQLWGSVREADRPSRAPAPALAPALPSEPAP